MTMSQPQHCQARQWDYGARQVAASCGTSRVARHGVLVVIAVSLVHGPNAFAQNKAAQTAAGAIIIQNNQLRRELGETKQELREIREGLGIEKAPAESGDLSLRPVALVASVAMILAVAAISLWAAREAAACSRYLRDGDFISFRRSHGLRGMFIALALAFIPVTIPWTITVVSGKKLPAAAAIPFLFGWMAWGIGVVVFMRRLLQESRVKRLFDAAANLRPVANHDRCFIRLPDGTIKGPGERTNVRILASQGKYPAGTQWSYFESGPWEELVTAQEAISSPDQFWVRTPQGMTSGPHSKDQLSKAMAVGRIPEGSEAASSPNGPWRKIVAKRVT
jgi:hypothetical protein